MNHNLQRLVSLWLQHLKIPVSPGYIKDQLLSHPDYPSLLSVTSTLDYLGINNAAMVVDKEKLHEIPVPFLAHVNAKGGDFILVTDTASLLRKQSDFLENWNGVVVMAEKPEQFNNAENQKWLTKGKRNKRITVFSITTLIALAIVAVSFQFTWLIAGLMITTMAGLAVAVMIVQHELGINNTLTERLCAAGNSTDCDAVLHSKKSKLSNWLTWADAGIVWFSTLFLLLTISLFTDTFLSLLILLTPFIIVSIPFTVLSFYYQWKVIKKWCTLCLLTIVILWLQAALLLPEAGTIGLQFIPAKVVGLVLLIFALIAAGWLLLFKPVLNNSRENEDKYYRLSRFKNNPGIFTALLQQQRKVDCTAWENDLQIGNANSPVQIMVACNPYCGPCAQTHKVLDELIASNDFGLTIRFGVTIENKEDTRTKAVEYIFQLMKDKESDIEMKREILNAWYADMNIEKFSNRYPLINRNEVAEILIKQGQWAKEAKIEFTPTVFINGYELPKEYKARDLAFVLKEYRGDNLVMKMLETENKTARAGLAL